MIEIIKPGTKEKISCNSLVGVYSVMKRRYRNRDLHNLHPLVATEKASI